MAAAIGVRGDYDTARLRELAKRSEDANQTRRLLALAAIYDGGSRTEAAKIGGVGLQTVRDWVLAFNAEGPPGLVNGKAPGNAPLLTQAHRQALLEIVESGPIPAVHGVVRWRLIDEFVPGVATVLKDVVVGPEDTIGEPVVAHELPDVFDRVEFG